MNNYPDLYFDYVGATGEHSITDYIDYTSNINYLYTSNSSNILSNQIIITSNILENDILITSNILDNASSSKTSNLKYNINKLINEEIEHISLPVPYNLKHTYIYNSNLLGEIRFYCESAKDFIVVIPEGVPDYRVKIDVDGKLKIFYTYDPLINATYLNGWVDVVNSIVALNASDANIGITIGGLQAEILNNFSVLEAEINALILGMTTMGLTNEEATYLRNLVRSVKEFRFEAINSIDNFYYLLRDAFYMRNTNLFNSAINVIGYLISTNPTIAFFLGVGGIAYGFIYGALQNLNYLNSISASLKENINTNSNITSNRRVDFLSSNFEQDINTYVELSSNIYNFSISQGFTNSNIITQQYLNAINTNELKLGQTNVSNIFVNSNALSNINLNQGFVNSNILNQQFISNLKCDNLFFNNSNISNVYASSNAVKNIVIGDMPNVNKKNAFYCVVNNVLYPNGGDIPYYAYHIDLRNYTRTGYLDYTSDPYRIFTLKAFYAPSYFQMLNSSGLPDICEYTIYMSYKQNSGGSGTKTGLNICAIGTPQSYHLDTIPPTRLFLLRNASENFNYLTILSKLSGDVSVIISDELN